MAPFGKIYSFMPNCRVFKILAAARVNGLELDIADYEHLVTNRTPEFLSKFPAGKVPAFEGADGFCLGESDAIAQYVAQSGRGRDQLLGRDAAASARIRQWISFTEFELTPFVLDLVIWRVDYGPYDAKTETKALSRLEYALSVLDKHVRGRTCLVGEELTLADLSVSSALVWAFLHVIDEPMRKQFPNLVEWYLRIIGIEELKDVFGPPNLISVRRVHA